MKILVIAPAGFHLGYLGCYGNFWIDTPALDALAAESTVFDQHISDRPSVDGAWWSWRIGRYSFPLSSNQDPHDSFDLLATLRGRGIPSVLITDSENDRPGKRNGWEKVHVGHSGEHPSAQKELWQSAAEAIRRLSLNDHGLVWLETNMLMPPWSPEESTCDYFSADPDGEEESIEPLLNPTPGLLDSGDETTFLRLQRTYATAVSQFDRQLGEFLQELQQNDLYDSSMIIVTTDRGLPLGEHGLLGDGRPWLHEELVHIPLMIRLPSGIQGSGRIAVLTQPVDLMATILEALGLTSVDCHGFSLLPLIRGQQERIHDFACSGLQIGAEVEYSLRTADWAFLLPDNKSSGDSTFAFRDRQLYVKPDDRWEVNNVVQHHIEFAEQLEGALRAFVKAPSKAHGWPSVGFEPVIPNT